MSAAPDDRKLLRLEVGNAETPIEKKPSWIKTRARMGPEFTELKGLIRREGSAHPPAEAGCPNILRVLGGPGGDVVDRWGSVHPPL